MFPFQCKRNGDDLRNPKLRSCTDEKLKQFCHRLKAFVCLARFHNLSQLGINRHTASRPQRIALLEVLFHSMNFKKVEGGNKDIFGFQKLYTLI